jgi:hypothetical protein
MRTYTADLVPYHKLFWFDSNVLLYSRDTSFECCCYCSPSTGTQFRYCCYCSVFERRYSTRLFQLLFFCVRQMLSSNVFFCFFFYCYSVFARYLIRKLLVLFFCSGDMLHTNIVAIVPMYLRDCILYEYVVIAVCLHLRGDTRYGFCCCSSVFEMYSF